MLIHTKLGLGGHSFIEELGNDPQASFEEQCAIVSACLDNGIRSVDTTYYQERLALGKVLQRLGRRDEAEIMAWNFYKQPGKENKLVGYTPLEPYHIETMLEELQTGYIDTLVIHVHGDIVKLRQEMELAEQWMNEGKVKKIGLGMVRLEHLLQLEKHHPVTHVLAPYNAFHQEAIAMFMKAREMGLTTVALSPFIRGWKLNEIGGEKAAAADVLLRWVAEQDVIDRVIVSMRKEEWIHSNLRAVDRGPLSGQEQHVLSDWMNRFGS